MSNGVVIVVAGDDKTGAVFEAVQKHLQQVNEKGKETSKSFTSSMRAMQESITLMRDAFVLDRVYSVFKEMIKSTVDLGMEIGHMAQQTGIGAQTLSVLKYTADQTGVSFETISKGFKKMSTDIFEWQHGEKLAGEAFTDLGFSLKDIQAKGQDLYGILAMVADQFKTMPDGPQKLAIAVELFGRAGQQMIPILNQGSEGLVKFRTQAQAMGVVLDEDGVQRMEALHSSAVQLEGTLSGLGIAITSALEPMLAPAASWMAHNFAAGLDAIGDAARDAVRQLALLGLYESGDFSGAAKQKAEWAKDDAAKGLAAHAKNIADFNPPKGLGRRPSPRTPPAIAGISGNAIDMEQRREMYRTFGEFGASSTLKNAEDSIRAMRDQGAKDDAALLEKLYPLADLQKQANAQMQVQIAEIFKSQAPVVALGQDKGGIDTAAIQGAAEKFAHSVFDPLFELNTSWHEKWKATRDGLMSDLGQMAESQLFKLLFGDPQGRGGRGLNGTSWEGDTTNPRSSVQGAAGGLLGGLLGHFLHRGAGVASNGGVGSGAGTVPTPAASLMQIGKKVGAAGGIQVVLNNNGAPLQVDQTQHQNDGGEQQVIQIMLKQLESNGPVAQGIMGMMGGL